MTLSGVEAAGHRCENTWVIREKPPILCSLIRLAVAGAVLGLAGCPRTPGPSPAGEKPDSAAPDDAAPAPSPDTAGPDARPRTDAAPDGAPEVPGGPLPTLARMEDARRLTRPVFERLVSDPDVVVRRRALLALARMRRAEGLAPLRTALGDEDPEARQLALFALGQIEPAAHRDAEEVLRTFLGTSPPAADRRAAVLALGKVGSEASEPALLEALESPEPRLREAAAKALGLLVMRGSPPRAAPLAPLVPRLDDTDAKVRRAAAFAFSRGAVPSGPDLGALSAALEKRLRTDEDPEVRIMAGRALAHVGMAHPEAALAALEGDQDWRVRVAAAKALARSAPPAKVSAALALAWRRIEEDPSRLTTPEVQPLKALLDAAIERNEAGLIRGLRRVHLGASKLLETGTLAPRGREALAHLRCLAALGIDRPRGRPRLVLGCAEGMEASSPVQPWEVKVLAARAWHGSSRARALRELSGLARDEDPRVRVAAVEAAETLSTPDRLGLFERALGDESPAVVAAAAHALKSAAPLFEIQERPAEELTVTEHTPEGPVVHSMNSEAVKAPPVPVEALTKALDRVDPERDVETAINLLGAAGRLRVQEAAERAAVLARHHNPAVRGEAREALEALGRDPGAEIAADPPNLIDPAELEGLAGTRPRVIFRTTAGEFTLELRPDLAPATVANLIALVRQGFYRDVPFHRVVPGFVVQVGDPEGTGFGGPGYTIRCEVTGEPYRRGSVGMALAGPDTGGSQIFITSSAQPHLVGRYTLFGQVVEGLEVVESLGTWDHIIEARVEGDPVPTVTETGSRP